MLEIFVSVKVPVIDFSGVFTVSSTGAVTDGSLDLEASTVHILFIVVVPILDSEISVFSSSTIPLTLDLDLYHMQ